MIAVRVRNNGANSRWYSGSGIFRYGNLSYREFGISRTLIYSEPHPNSRNRRSTAPSITVSMPLVCCLLCMLIIVRMQF